VSCDVHLKTHPTAPTFIHLKILGGSVRMSESEKKRRRRSSGPETRSKRRRIVSEDAEDSESPQESEQGNSSQTPRTLPARELSEISAPEDADWDGVWISATATRNHLLRDPVVDWFKYNYSGFVTRNPTYTKDILGAVNDRRNPNSFTEYIMEQGCTFESHVMRLLTERFGKDLVLSIGGELNPRSPEKVLETIQAMNLGIPIIHSGLLHNPENCTYGIPDLMVRSDWINNIFKIEAIEKTQTRIPAPRLRDVHDPESSPRYHYIIVDIKFSTLLLRADGVHILNAGSFPAYKSQLHIYNEALARIQGYNPQKAFILGRKWRFSSKGETYKGKSCFDRAGTIDYTGVDKDYVAKTESALKWLRDCRTPEARGWNVTDVPLERPELYPNMSNTHDYPWHNAKSRLADQIKELTSLWMVGTKHREKAHSSEVYQWTDEKCTPDALGVTGKYTSRILDKVLEINQPHRNPEGTPVLPKIITNNFKGWQNKKELEFYVDFETVNDVLTDFEALPNVENTSLIFMIGVGFNEPISGRWTYREFTVDKLTFKEEGRICQEFAEYIRSEATFYEVDTPMCVHWAPAEDNFWNDAVERHNPESDEWRTDEWEWLDLLKVFKEEPITVKGALGFSLKQIAKAMCENGLITSGWDTGSSCLDGQGAMVGAWRAYKESNLLKKSMREVPLMREIIKYNEVDVKVLQEIIGYLRTYHTDGEADSEGSDTDHDSEDFEVAIDDGDEDVAIIEISDSEGENLEEGVCVDCPGCSKRLRLKRKASEISSSSDDEDEDEYEAMKDLVEEIRTKGSQRTPLDEVVERAMLAPVAKSRRSRDDSSTRPVKTYARKRRRVFVDSSDEELEESEPVAPSGYARRSKRQRRSVVSYPDFREGM